MSSWEPIRAQTSASLNLSRHTVKQHTSAVYRKLGARNRA
jgi:DNA-binding CsgD family transcriptional regulator